MAVEIPVYINIQDAFKQAAAEIPKQMPVLEKAISENTLKVKFNGLSMRDLLTGDLPMSELQGGLRAIRREFEAVVSGAQKARKGMSIGNLIKSYTLLEQRITGTYNKFTPLVMTTEAKLGQIQKKIIDLKNTLSTAAPASDLFNKTNYELQLQERQYASVNAQLMRYKAGIDSSNGSLTKQNSLLRSISGYFSGIYAAHTVLRFVKQIRNVTEELEYQRVALGHLLGDMQLGNELFEKTVAAAQESPFRITQLVTYTKQLAAYRIEQDKLFETTQRLADISAGLGVDMNRLILAYGQVRAASVLRGQELRQFTEAGIPLVEELAKKFRELGREGTTTADVFKLISERAVPFEMVKEIFEDMTNAGGMFYKMQEEQAKTLKGRWEKLKDAYDKALMSIGEDPTFQKWDDMVLSALNGIAKGLKGVVRVANAATVSWVAYKVATAVVASDGFRLAKVFAKDYGAAGLLTVAINGVTTAVKKFTIALKSNWVGLALSAVAGVITWLTTFKKKTNETTEELSDMKQAIENLKKANEDYDYSKGLIAAYGDLADKTNKTDAESRRLAVTVEELKRIYPQLTSKLDDDNVALQEKIGLLEEAATAQHNLSVEEAKERLQTQKGIIRGLEEDLKEAEAKKDAAQARRRAAEQAEEVQRLRERAAGVKEGSTRLAKQLAEFTEAAAKEAKAAEEEYDKIHADLTKARKEAESMENLIHPEEVAKGMQQWAKEIQNIQNRMMELGDTPAFTNEQLEGFTSIYDMSKKLKTRIDDLTTSLKGMNSLYESMANKESDAAQELYKEIKATEKTLEIAEAIRIALHLSFGKKSGSDKRLSNLRSEISEITNAYKKFIELKKYMSDDRALFEIDKLFPQLQGQAPTLEKTIEILQTKLDEVREKLKKSPKDKVLLDMQRTLETEISNLNFGALKDKIDKQLKALTADIKHSETARNFYNSILGMTGDEKMAATLTMQVYGTTGKEFKERVQDEMFGALESVKGHLDKDFYNEMIGNVTIFDMKEIRKQVDKLPDTIRPKFEELLSQEEGYNADWLNNLIKTYEKAKTYEERITDIQKREAQKRKEIAASDKLTSEQKKSYTEASKKKESEDIAKVQLEALKDTYTWTKAFEDLEGVSTATIDKLIKLIDDYVLKYGKDLDPQQIKELARAKEQAEAQKRNRNAYKATAKAIKDVIEALKKKKKLEEDGKEDSEDYQKTLDDEQKALKDLSDALNAVESELNEVINASKKLFDAFGSDENAAYFSEQMDNLTTILSGTTKTIVGAARVIANPADMQGWKQAIYGLVDVIVGVVNAKNAKKLKDLNRQIEDQSDLLEELEYSYQRLEAAMAKAFGSDYIYNYNQQLKNLAAQQSAYEKQARLEREKGKKADEDKIKDYENSARDVADKIADMQSQLSEFFAGTDVASAAKDFASAWIDAYKQFGSTTDAMKEKFQDMINEMVQSAMFAQLGQYILEDFFKEIDQKAKDGELTAQEVAQIANMAPEYVSKLNDAFTVANNELQKYGLNLRDTVGTFTGISRNIAGASEESITGLTAGINAQNFYMQHIDASVTAILAAMTGGTTVTNVGAEGAVTNPYNEAMMLYAAHIPTIEDKLATLLTEVQKVIKPRSTNPDWALHTVVH